LSIALSALKAWTPGGGRGGFRISKFLRSIRHPGYRALPCPVVGGCRWSLKKPTEKATSAAGRRASDKSAEGFAFRSAMSELRVFTIATLPGISSTKNIRVNDGVNGAVVYFSNGT
jgi:hypothetical protein